MAQTIHLTLKQTKRTNDFQTTQFVEHFHKAITELNPSFIEPYIREEDVFNEKTKWEFLADLRNRIAYMKRVLGELKPEKRQSFCHGCYCDKIVWDYYNPATGDSFLAYRFEIKKGRLKDVVHCLYHTYDDMFAEMNI